VSHERFQSSTASLENRPAYYFTFPKATERSGSSWDYAATACLIVEIGASINQFSGLPLKLIMLVITFMNSKGVLYASDRRLNTLIPSTPN
jgi:3'-phosphoadenosine 5'-phosphosulfate (PAPS) 3'-phosphatase